MEFRRTTRQRQVILEELRKLPSHPTAADLHEIVRKRLPKISLGTIYRNLELLANSGMIRKLDTSGKEALFDANLQMHYHIQCSECGRLDDLKDPPEIHIGEPIAKQHGWEIQEYRVKFLGICPDCRIPRVTDSPSANKRIQTD